MKKPKVTIILPNFNSENFLKKTINSILSQTYKNFELLIIDDGSNKKTLRVLTKYKKKKKIRRNLGIKKSNSNYLAFIDSDDL